MCRGWDIFETRSSRWHKFSVSCPVSCPLDAMTGACVAFTAFSEISHRIWRQTNYFGSLHCHIVSTRPMCLAWKYAVFLSQHWNRSRKTHVRKAWTIGKSTSFRRKVNIRYSSRPCQLTASLDVLESFANKGSPLPPPLVQYLFQDNGIGPLVTDQKFVTFDSLLPFSLSRQPVLYSNVYLN